MPGGDLGGPPDLGLRADRGDDTDRGSADHRRGRVEHAAALRDDGTGSGLDTFGYRQRFPGQRGLIDLQVDCFDDAAVGGNDLTRPHLDQIAWSQLVGIHALGSAAGHPARRRGLDRQHAAQQTLGAHLLGGRQHGVAGQHRPDQDGIDRRAQHRAGRRPDREHRRERVGQLVAHGGGEFAGQPQRCARGAVEESGGCASGRGQPRRRRRSPISGRRQGLPDLLGGHRVPLLGRRRRGRRSGEQTARRQQTCGESGGGACGDGTGPLAPHARDQQQTAEQRGAGRQLDAAPADTPGCGYGVQDAPRRSQVRGQHVGAPRRTGALVEQADGQIGTGQGRRGRRRHHGHRAALVLQCDDGVCEGVAERRVDRVELVERRAQFVEFVAVHRDEVDVGVTHLTDDRGRQRMVHVPDQHPSRGRAVPVALVRDRGGVPAGAQLPALHLFLRPVPDLGATVLGDLLEVAYLQFVGQQHPRIDEYRINAVEAAQGLRAHDDHVVFVGHPAAERGDESLPGVARCLRCGDHRGGGARGQISGQQPDGRGGDALSGAAALGVPFDRPGRQRAGSRWRGGAGAFVGLLCSRGVEAGFDTLPRAGAGGELSDLGEVADEFHGQ